MNPGMMGFGRFGGAGLGDNLLTPWLVLVAVSLLVSLVLYIKERIRRAQAEENVASLKSELQALRSRCEKHEYRMERFELLWFPVVSASSQEKTILGVTPGAPHCRACLLPLALDRGHWACRQCSARHPETLGDLMVLDGISKQALAWFQERHPGYRIPKV